MSLHGDAGMVGQFLNKPLVTLALIVGCVIIGLGAWLLARRQGWRRVPAVLAGCGLALALAVTLARPGMLHPGIETFDPLGRCVGQEFALGSTKQRLNFYMLMPFAFFAVLATRRPLVIMAASALLSAGIELTQAVVGIGVCDAQDFYNNTAGGLIAAVAGWLLSMLIPPRPRSAPAPPEVWGEKTLLMSVHNGQSSTGERIACGVTVPIETPHKRVT